MKVLEQYIVIKSDEFTVFEILRDYLYYHILHVHATPTCRSTTKSACSYFVCTAPILEQSSFTVDEGDGSAIVCMHFGGEALATNATFTVQDRSALSKFSSEIIIT